MLNNSREVTSLCEQVFRNGRCYDDQLHCLFMVAKALRQATLYRESLKSMFEILRYSGEEELRPLESNIVRSKLHGMNTLFQNRTDQDVLDMNITNNKKIITLLKVYELMGPLFHYTMPELLAAASLRMVELTMENGLSPMAPMAFAFYGEVLAADGNLVDACRLGRLALKLIGKESLSAQKSGVILVVYTTTLWASEPLQAVIEAHQLGQKAGQQRGDYTYIGYNWHMSVVTAFIVGQDLNRVKWNARAFVTEIRHKGHVDSMILLYWQAVALSEGLQALEEERNEEFSCEADVLTKNDQNIKSVFIDLLSKILKLIRKYLFNQLADDALDINISACIAEKKETLRPILLMGIFFEGLACFKLARQSTDKKRATLLQQGESVVARMRVYNEHSKWNFENKMLLLEAERMHVLGNLDQAEFYYSQSILSAQKHKFVHEEAIGCDLLGEFLYERSIAANSHFAQSKPVFLHSIECYEKWGAFAVARRVEASIQVKFASDMRELGADSLSFTHALATNDGVSSRKRQNQH